MAKKKPGDWKTPPPCDIKSTGRALTAEKGKRLRGKRVRVHLNLHNGCLAISHKGKIVGYSRTIKLKNVRPKIQMAGYRKCHSTKVRNVHAWVEGEYAGGTSTPSGSGWRPITYRCKTHGPNFYYKRGGGVFEGAAEVRLVRTKTKIKFVAKGKLAAKNPPDCGCQLPGGACDCGAVQPPEGVQPCGSVPAEGVAPHLARAPHGDYLLLLDLHNVRAYGAADWYQRGRCPLLAGWIALSGPEAGQQIMRDSMAGVDSMAGLDPDNPPRSADLSDLCRRVGVGPEEADSLLAWEGSQWHQAEGHMKNPGLPAPPFMPKRPFQAACLDAWGEVDPSTIVQEATASLHRSVVKLAQDAGLPVTVLHDRSGYILVLESEAPGVADTLRRIAAEHAAGYDSQDQADRVAEAEAGLAEIKGQRGKEITAERRALKADLKAAKAALRSGASAARSGVALAAHLDKAADDLLGIKKATAAAANPQEPAVYTTPDGYTFYRQPDGSYTDAPDPRGADMTFRSFQELAAQDNPPAWGLSLEPVVGPMLLTNPPPWYLPH